MASTTKLLITSSSTHIHLGIHIYLGTSILKVYLTNFMFENIDNKHSTYLRPCTNTIPSHAVELSTAINKLMFLHSVYH